jgi:hypothetical protein
MDYEFWAILILICCGIPLIIGFINHLNNGNIFYQKIEYLNQVLNNVKPEHFEEYKISGFEEFEYNIDISVGEQPQIWKSNMQNNQYRNLIEEHINRPKKLKKLAIRMMLIFVLIQALLLGLVQCR